MNFAVREKIFSEVASVLDVTCVRVCMSVWVCPFV